MSSEVEKARVGIYAGTFDPVHAGHIAFALQARQAARLDGVFFMPERRPRGKKAVTHYAHRVAMIRRAIRPYATLEVLETSEKSFSTVRTLPHLKKQFPGTTMVFLCGSDVVAHMGTWPHIAQLLTEAELCIGMRHSETTGYVQQALEKLPVSPRRLVLVETSALAVSSSQIRRALRTNRGVHGLLESVKRYAAQEWLYV